ncbi:MATE family efflux transporter [Brevibacillus dissolubilis]|uniref:MATE family efflux transporter n=1 Tax=Brevibacillus dissolubilis TaxID=1844116 RepID=UPI002100537B|nr:MATE family efflux transporter [Brevibacillus dissolubilis]
MKTDRSSLPQQQTGITHQQYLVLATPLILSTLSTPLLGAVDTAVVGQLPDPAYIGGVAVGTLIFNTLYWLFGFLRVSTSGFSAQAHGAGDRTEVLLSLLRPVGIALWFGLLFVALQVPIKQAAIMLIQPGQEVGEHAVRYFDVRIWGAPFLLMNYALVGWLIGVSQVRLALYLQILMNLINIALCIGFVRGFAMDVSGVALASLLSEMSATAIGLWLVLRRPDLRQVTWRWAQVWASETFVNMLKMNRDLFIRTCCLLGVFLLFTSQGASMGEVTLAANAVLLQVHFLMAYIFDGFANASSILVGRAIGSKNKPLYQQAIQLSAIWAFAASLVLTVITYLWGDVLITWFTSIHDVQVEASEYLIWVVFYPLVAFWGLQLNGIFSGATEAASIRNSMIISFACYLLVAWLFVPAWSNHGLWLAFIIFSLARSLALWVYLPRLNRTAL